ncbi:MAG: hypothetical protein WBG17_03435 [Burkholderiaceae bacterium]
MSDPEFGFGILHFPSPPQARPVHSSPTELRVICRRAMRERLRSHNQVRLAPLLGTRMGEAPKARRWKQDGESMTSQEGHGRMRHELDNAWRQSNAGTAAGTLAMQAAGLRGGAE